MGNRLFQLNGTKAAVDWLLEIGMELCKESYKIICRQARPLWNDLFLPCYWYFRDRNVGGLSPPKFSFRGASAPPTPPPPPPMFWELFWDMVLGILNIVWNLRYTNHCYYYYYCKSLSVNIQCQLQWEKLADFNAFPVNLHWRQDS